MRIRIVVLFCLIFLSLAARADERLPVLKVGSDVYSNVTVTAVTLTDIYFTSDHGMANAKLKNLDPALQKHFKYDAAKAAAAEKNQKAYVPAFPQGDVVINRANAQSVMDNAMAQVKAIVNQPITHLPRTADMEVGWYDQGWFHPGAQKPNFNTADVRTTRKLDYAKYSYVTSPLNDGVVFIGSELEFNPQTKYFYTDRSVPKKKLTEEEMLEINRLYRIIGKSEAALNAPPDNPSSSPTPAQTIGGSESSPGSLSGHKGTIIVVVASVLVSLLAVRFLANRRSE